MAVDIQPMKVPYAKAAIPLGTYIWRLSGGYVGLCALIYAYLAL